jgi:PAS domain S-box-containing protein
MENAVKDHKTKKELIDELTQLQSQNAALKESITGIISAELAAEEARHYAESIVETVRTPLLILDADLKIISANRYFYSTFNVIPSETLGCFIYDLGNEQWDIPLLRGLLENILPEKEAFDDFEVAHDFPDIGHKVMLLNARQVSRKDIDARLILLAIEDITERRQLEALLTESEERFRRLFETASDGILLLEKGEGKITHANPAAEKMLGYTPKESFGNKLQDMGISLDLGDFHTTMHNLNKNGIIMYDDVPVKNKAGELIDTDIYLVDRAKLVQCNIRDISKRKLVEKKLRESEEKYRLVVDNIADVIIVMDFDLRLTYASASITRLRGYTAEEAVGQTLEQMMTPESLQIVAKVLEEDLRLEAGGTADPGRIRVLELEEYRKDGSAVWVENRLSFVRDAAQKAVGIISVSHDIAERKQADAERERLLLAIEQSDDMFVITNLKGTIQYVNPAFERVTGYTRDEAIGQNPRMLKSGKQGPDFYQNLWETLSGGNTFKGSMINKRKDGTFFTEETTISPVRDPSGRIVSYIAVKHDITEQLQLAAQFQQAQKMESVGRLAGGVAHDYNNMLSVIMGYTEMAMEKVQPDDPFHADLVEILKAAQRSTDITRQLLAFARKQTIAPKVVDLNAIVESMLRMLGRLIGENIDLAWLPGKQLWSVKIDPSQIDQILVNLCVNARDAIDGVGKVTMETGNITFDDDYCDVHAGFSPGEFLLLAVSDNGCGMDTEILTNIFEPFFTTKGVAEGTGLGLPTVYGIVKQNNGFINVYSEPGKGTTFRIYLPRHVSEQHQMRAATKIQTPMSRGETVLLVEDEPSIMRMAKMMLERLGYQVLAAGTPSQAVALAEQHAGAIDLLITDVVMPKMSGRTLADQINALYPNIKTLFMSGYTANVIAHNGVLDEGVNFIQKPFSLHDLGIKILMVLDEK